MKTCMDHSWEVLKPVVLIKSNKTDNEQQNTFHSHLFSHNKSLDKYQNKI